MPSSGQPPARAPTMTMIPRARADGDEGVRCPGRTVDDVPRLEARLLFLDQQRAFTGEHEKVLLVRFGVVQVSRASGTTHGR
jgi:hypothetical protein